MTAQTRRHPATLLLVGGVVVLWVVAWGRLILGGVV